MFATGREAIGSVLGGVFGGLAAWAYGTMMGGVLHLAWLGTAIGLSAAIFMTFALATVDRRKEARERRAVATRTAGFQLAAA